MWTYLVIKLGWVCPTKIIVPDTVVLVRRQLRNKVLFSWHPWQVQVNISRHNHPIGMLLFASCPFCSRSNKIYHFLSHTIASVAWVQSKRLLNKSLQFYVFWLQMFAVDIQNHTESKIFNIVMNYNQINMKILIYEYVSVSHCLNCI